MHGCQIHCIRLSSFIDNYSNWLAIIVLDIQILFSSLPNIMNSIIQGLAQEVVGWEVEAGHKPKVGYTTQWSRKAAIVWSLKYTNSHNLLVMLRRLLTAI